MLSLHYAPDYLFTHHVPTPLLHTKIAQGTYQWHIDPRGIVPGPMNPPTPTHFVFQPNYLHTHHVPLQCLCWISGLHKVLSNGILILWAGFQAPWDPYPQLPTLFDFTLITISVIISQCLCLIPGLHKALINGILI